MKILQALRRSLSKIIQDREDTCLERSRSSGGNRFSARGLQYRLLRYLLLSTSILAQGRDLIQRVPAVVLPMSACSCIADVRRRGMGRGLDMIRAKRVSN